MIQLMFYKNIFGNGEGGETFTSEEEWEKKYKKLKDGWDLYLQQSQYG